MTRTTHCNSTLRDIYKTITTGAKGRSTLADTPEVTLTDEHLHILEQVRGFHASLITSLPLVRLNIYKNSCLMLTSVTKSCNAYLIRDWLPAMSID